MTSTAQVQANRSNAQKSSGPRTAEGKAVVAHNAIKHGLLAQQVVVKGEDPAEFECYRDEMLAELAPAGTLEGMLARRIVGLSWRLCRAERLQTAAFDKIEEPKEPEVVYSREEASLLLHFMAEHNMHPPAPPARNWKVGRQAVQDFSQEKILDRLLVYERRIEHSLYRTMAELRKQKLLRGTEPAEGEWARSTVILPVTGVPNALAGVGGPSSMGVGPMNTEEIHGQDARATTPPQGGTPNELRQTNPIGTGSNASGTPNVGGDESRQTKPIDAGSDEEPPGGGTTNGELLEAQEPVRQTNPIREPGAVQPSTVSEPRKIRRFPNTAEEMTYDSYLGRWVATGVALDGQDANRADPARRQ